MTTRTVAVYDHRPTRPNVGRPQPLGPYNLPSDLPVYPIFKSMKERKTYLGDDLKKRFEFWLDVVIRDMLRDRLLLPPGQPRPELQLQTPPQTQFEPQPGPEREHQHGQPRRTFRDRDWTWSVGGASEGGVSSGREQTCSPRREREYNNIGGNNNNERGRTPGREEMDDVQELPGWREAEGLSVQEQLYLTQYEREWNYNIGLMDVVFVGDFTKRLPLHFKPATGHLLISHFAGKPPGLPLSKGYIAPYQEDRYNFRREDILLRLGNFDQLPASVEDRNKFIYRPFFGVEMFCYREPEGSAAEEWMFLGYQNPIRRGYVPPDASRGLGCDLQVGVHLKKNEEERLTPQRGDLIIKGQVWDRSFNHEKTFWRSMVKWYKPNRPNFTWGQGDMLIRRFQDNCLHCRKENCKDRYGWVELFQYDGNTSKWIFWGRCKVLIDYPWARNGFHCQGYCCDGGDASDEEYENTAPR